MAPVPGSVRYMTSMAAIPHTRATMAYLVSQDSGPHVFCVLVSCARAGRTTAAGERKKSA